MLQIDSILPRNVSWVVCANTTNTFKARLDNSGTIKFRAQLQGTGSRSECLYEES